MDTRTLVAIVVVIAVIVIIAAWLIARRRSSAHLKKKFGPEYDRAVQQHGDPRHAEAALLERERRVEKFSLRPLPPADRERYGDDWAGVQRRFVDDPATAVSQADALVTTIMSARGYPMADFEQRAADLSVSYPSLVQNYRSARAITLRHNQGESTTEELRRAMVHFRSLFDELLESPKHQHV
jgi:hypothetical protein